MIYPLYCFIFDFREWEFCFSIYLCPWLWSLDYGKTTPVRGGRVELMQFQRFDPSAMTTLHKLNMLVQNLYWWAIYLRPVAILEYHNDRHWVRFGQNIFVFQVLARNVQLDSGHALNRWSWWERVWCLHNFSYAPLWLQVVYAALVSAANERFPHK